MRRSAASAAAAGHVHGHAVLHLPSSTVNLVVDLFCIPSQIAHYKARIGSLGSVLGFGNDAPFLIPTTGPILEPFEEADFSRRFFDTYVRRAAPAWR